MSFILDALKKSESDRQQQATPGIASVPVGRADNGGPRWLPYVLVLLAVNLAAVVFLLFRPATAPSADDTTAAVQPERAPSSAVDAQNQPTGRPATETGTGTGTTSRTPDPPAQQAQSPAPAETAAPVAALPAEPRPAPVTAEPAVTRSQGNAASGNEPSAAGAAGSGYVEEPYLTLDELRASGAMNLPDLHIDLHVYSDNPGERFVFINMTQYRENATLDDGPLLRRITPEGVILEYRGSTFLVTRD